MKVWSLLTFVVVLGLMAGLAEAKGNKAAKGPSVNGTISAIDGANITIHPKAKKKGADQPADVVVVGTDSTAVTVNGDKKNVADLAVGQSVKISLDTDGKTATSIVAGKGKGKGKKGSAPAATAPATASPATAPATQPAN